MPKTPKDSPTSVGQRVIWRGRGNKGKIDKISENWVWVKWDERGGGPEICHLNELQLDDAS